MDEDVADVVVVDEVDAEQAIEQMARQQYNDIPVEALEADRFEVRTDSARWANVIAPKIRSIAGYRDAGHGTYQIDGPIALIPERNCADTPAEAVSMQASQYVKKLHDLYGQIAYNEYSQQREEYLETIQ